MYFSAAHLSSPSSGLHHRLSLLTDDFQSRSPGPSLAGQTASCSLTASCDTGVSLCRQWLPACSGFLCPQGVVGSWTEATEAPQVEHLPLQPPPRCVQSRSHVHLFVTPWAVAQQASLSFTISSTDSKFLTMLLALTMQLLLKSAASTVPLLMTGGCLAHPIHDPEPPTPISRKTP